MNKEHLIATIMFAMLLLLAVINSSCASSHTCSGVVMKPSKSHSVVYNAHAFSKPHYK